MGIIKPVKIKNIVIGEGRPKIIAPIVSKTHEAIIEDAKRCINTEIDLVEWRVDFYEDVEDISAVLKTLENLREILNDKPIVFTFRTQNEGGEKFISSENYAKLNKAVAKSGFADIIDIEVFMEDNSAAKNIWNIHEAGKLAIGSYHNFLKTPREIEIIHRFRDIKCANADICKIALMPKKPKDVLLLLSATNEVYTNYTDRPLISISMSKMGAMSRIYGGLYGSSATFGNIGEQSAPGQIEVSKLSCMINLVYSTQGL